MQASREDLFYQFELYTAEVSRLDRSVSIAADFAPVFVSC
jgi:hypothetical protein